MLELANAVRAAFPVRMGTTKLNGCLQGKDECVRAFYYRLYEQLVADDRLAAAKREKAQAKSDRELQLVIVEAITKVGGAPGKKDGYGEEMQTEKGEGRVTGGAGFVKPMTIPSETVLSAECARRRVNGVNTAHRTRGIKPTEARGKGSRRERPRTSV